MKVKISYTVDETENADERLCGGKRQVPAGYVL